MNLWFLLLLLIFPISHFIECTWLINRTFLYIDEYYNYLKTGDDIMLVFYQTRITHLLRKVNYKSKIYLTSNIDFKNHIVIHRENTLMDVYLDPAYQRDFIHAMNYALGELSRLRLFGICPCYWAKKIFFLPISALAYFGIRPRKNPAFFISLIGWVITILAATHHNEIREFINHLLRMLMH